MGRGSCIPHIWSNHYRVGRVSRYATAGAVQGYVGNALEPMVFGKSLNMTPLSILAALVIWSALWGLMGAIFSVPLLGIQKILLSHTNHPMAKYVIMLIREDATIDEQSVAEEKKNMLKKNKADSDSLEPGSPSAKTDNPAAMD